MRLRLPPARGFQRQIGHYVDTFSEFVCVPFMVNELFLFLAITGCNHNQVCLNCNLYKHSFVTGKHF